MRSTTTRRVRTLLLPTCLADVSGSSMDDMVMLCVAMLVGAASGLLLALRLRRAAARRALASLIRHLVAAASPRRAATGPPYVWEFSVIRC